MSKPSYGKLARLAFGRRKTMKCHYRKESLACAFHYNGLCLRDHNYECPGLAMKNLSHGEMVQIAEARKAKNCQTCQHEGEYSDRCAYCKSNKDDVGELSEWESKEDEIVQCRNCANTPDDGIDGPIKFCNTFKRWVPANCCCSFAVKRRKANAEK